jgi:hypothetical protein
MPVDTNIVGEIVSLRDFLV